jgi:hypothetical protein
MSQSLKLALFAALATLVFALPAQSARRDGLNNNVLIEDYNDVFTYPQRAGNALNTNRVRLNHAGGEATDATIFVKKGNGGWGLGVRATQGNVDPTEVKAAPTMAEFAYSGGDWGIALRFGMGQFTVDPANDKSNSAMNIGFLAGYTIKDTAEIGLGVTFVSAEDAAEATYTDMEIGLSARGFKKMQNKVSFGWTFDFGFQSGSKSPKMGDEETSSGLSVEAGAGPVYAVGKGTVALHATLGFQSAEDTAKTASSSITIPGVNLAFETPLNDWIDFRAGAGYSFSMTTVTPDGGKDTKINHSAGTLGMAGFEPGPTGSMGLTAHWGNLQFDASLNRDFLTNGPYLMTGTETGPWATKVAATYKW